MRSIERILVDIDTQLDFMRPDGALYVPNAVQIVPNLVRLIGLARASRVPVISSADCHVENDPEFEQFPPHCVDGTAGQAKLPETLLPRRLTIGPDERVEGLDRLFDEYDQLVFETTTFDVWTNPSAAGLIESLSVGEYVVFGVATDYCVRDAAMGLLKRGCRVVVVGDAIQAITEQTGRAAVEEMTAAGARWVTTDEVVGESP